MSPTERERAQSDAQMKTHPTRRTERLIARAKRAERALVALVEIHHSTITGSKLHSPERVDWRDCQCRSCAAVPSFLDGMEIDVLAGAGAAVKALEELAASGERPA